MTSPDRGGAGAGREVETLILLADPDIVGAEDDVDALGLEDLFDGGRNILVFAGCQPRASFHDGHVSPEAPVHLRELERNVAAADDHEMGWHRVEFEDRDVGEELDIVQAGDVRHHRAATDVEEDPVGVQDVLVDPHRVWVLEAGMAAKDGAAVHPVEPVLDTLAVVEHDLVFARLDFRHVHADRTGCDAIFRAAAG